MPPGSTAPRSYNKGQVGLELDQSDISYLKSAEGGMASASVLQEAPGNAERIYKHLGPHKFDPITVEVGLAMARGFYDWVQKSLAKQYERRDGAIVAADSNYFVRDRLSFYKALIHEVTFPGLDASSKDAAALTIKFAPEWTAYKGEPGTERVKPYDGKGGRQKLWTVSNFVLDIDGLDCTRVTKVNALTIKQDFVEEEIGHDRAFTCEPSKLTFPDLVVTFSEASSASWYKWYQAMVINGEGHSVEKTGTITWLDPSLKEPLAYLHLDGLGISKLARDKLEAGTDGIRRATATLYCEQMSFEITAAGRR